MLDLTAQIESSLRIDHVGIVEFAESDAYCDRPLYPGQQVLLKLIFLEEMEGWEEDILNRWIAGGRNGAEIEISPGIRERRDYLREHGYKHFREIELVGGRRSSKGFCTGIAMTKVMYDCLQTQDPGTYYGIAADKEIYFSCIASSETQAKDYQFADLSNTIMGCRAMQPHIRRSIETEISIASATDLAKIAAHKRAGRVIKRDIAKIRGKAFAANAGTFRGQTAMAIAIDEMAHMLPGESKASADQIYEAARPSLAQFGRDGIMFLNSSPYTKIGKFFEQYEAAMELVKGTKKPAYPLMFAFKFPSWALFQDYKLDPQRKFSKVITPSADWNPDEKDEKGEYVWSEEDRQNILIEREEEATKPEVYKVEKRAYFAEVIDAYLRPEMVDLMYKGRPRWIDGEVKYFPLRTNWDDSRNIYRYVAHFDPSSTTAGFGFAMGHTELITDSEGVDAEHVIFDILWRWDPSDFPGGAINWEYVLGDIKKWIDIFRPYQITWDQFQTEAPGQELMMWIGQQGISTRAFKKQGTNETNWNRAETFRTALYQGIVHAPKDIDEARYSSEELKYLQEIRTAGRYPRVDKQDIGPVQTKDIADCIMEVVEALVGNIVGRQMRQNLGETPISLGGQGGYPLGGPDRGGKGRNPNVDAWYDTVIKRSGEQRFSGSGFSKPSQSRTRGRPIQRPLPRR